VGLEAFGSIPPSLPVDLVRCACSFVDKFGESHSIFNIVFLVCYVLFADCSNIFVRAAAVDVANSVTGISEMWLLSASTCRQHPV
jgi:hypothetical protein